MKDTLRPNLGRRAQRQPVNQRRHHIDLLRLGATRSRRVRRSVSEQQQSGSRFPLEQLRRNLEHEPGGLWVSRSGPYAGAQKLPPEAKPCANLVAILRRRIERQVAPFSGSPDPRRPE